MPTVSLTWSDTVSDNFGGGAIDNVAADDGSFAGADTVGQVGTFNLTDLPANAGTVNSVQLKLTDAHIELRGGSSEITTTIGHAGGSYYNEVQVVGESLTAYTLTSRTTSDGSSAWTPNTGA